MVRMTSMFVCVHVCTHLSYWCCLVEIQLIYITVWNMSLEIVILGFNWKKYFIFADVWVDL